MKTFQLLRGKSNDEFHADSEDRIIGKFKVSLKIDQMGNNLETLCFPAYFRYTKD